MNGFERVHECVGGYTDAGQHEVHPNEPIVRCKDCELYDREDGLCYRDPEHSGCYRPACDDGFCAWAVKRED